MSSFHERQKDLFNHLKVAEDQYSFSKKNNKVIDAPDYGVVDRRTYKKLKHEMRQFRGRESIFKRNEANIRQCLRPKTVPDYMKNPQNWVYYSLSDVTTDQLSDSTNTATALAFMREMEDRAAEKQEMNCDIDETGAVFKKPTFNVSKTVKKQPEVVEDKPVFKSNKIIMPECVVGVTKKKEKKDKPRRQSAESPDAIKKVELKLNHLYVEDDEE